MTHTPRSKMLIDPLELDPLELDRPELEAEQEDVPEPYDPHLGEALLRPGPVELRLADFTDGLRLYSGPFCRPDRLLVRLGIAGLIEKGGDALHFASEMPALQLSLREAVTVREHDVLNLGLDGDAVLIRQDCSDDLLCRALEELGPVRITPEIGAQLAGLLVPPNSKFSRLGDIYADLFESFGLCDSPEQQEAAKQRRAEREADHAERQRAVTDLLRSCR